MCVCIVSIHIHSHANVDKHVRIMFFHGRIHITTFQRKIWQNTSSQDKLIISASRRTNHSYSNVTRGLFHALISECVVAHAQGSEQRLVHDQNSRHCSMTVGACPVERAGSMLPAICRYRPPRLRVLLCGVHVGLVGRLLTVKTAHRSVATRLRLKSGLQGDNFCQSSCDETFKCVPIA